MKKFLFAAGALLLLTACATAKAVSGNYAVGTSYTVTLGQTWSDVSSLLMQRPKALHMLTVDGPGLNRLYITEGLAPGDFIVKPVNKETPTPTYKAGLSPNELVEFVIDSISALEYEAPESANLRPAKFGAVDGVRFDLTARTKAGLNMSGTAQLAEKGGKLYLMLYLAPTEHYYNAHIAEVERTFGSATLTN